MIFCLYLGIPLVSHLLNWLLNLKNHAYLYVLIGCLLLAGTLIPTVKNVHLLLTGKNTVSSVLQMNIFGSGTWCDSVWMLYLVIGFALKRFDLWIHDNLRTSRCVLSFIVCFALLYGFHVLAWNKSIQDSYFYSNVLLVISATSLFVLMHRFCNFAELPRTISSVLTGFSRLSFGIYMIHSWIATALLPIIPIGRGWKLSIILFLACYFGSALLTWILSRIPLLSRWIFLMK